ncbi:MAG: peptidase M23, partial [Sulfitobacter sp.]
MMRRLALVMLIWPFAAFAQSEAADQARRAMADLETASAALAAADGARDRVKALTQTIQAFEVGLGAMREGLR